mmetsp:Transcript_45010/g.74702  ORF Transcript_45010/g.74702 Transcript_45010/m.74702 type:complete len:163 (-) Transcript_45010:250-738(-)
MSDMQNWVDLVPVVTGRTADGTGRDTYIRRDPVACYGKQLYKSAPREVTRFGTAGSAIPSERHTGYMGHIQNSSDMVGVVRGQQLLPDVPRDPPPEPTFPIEVNKFTTMKELMQDRCVTGSTMPGHLEHINGYAGHQPRNPDPVDEVARWQPLSTVPVAQTP